MKYIFVDQDVKLSMEEALEAQDVHLVYLDHQLQDLWLEVYNGKNKNRALARSSYFLFCFSRILFKLNLQASEEPKEPVINPGLIRSVSQKGAKSLQTALVDLNRLLQQVIFS